MSDRVTITLAEAITEPTILRMAAADLRNGHRLGWGGLPRSLPGTLTALADAIEQAGEVEMEPTREHWTRYEPWMRDVLADDARVSRASGGTESRSTWGIYRRRTDSWAAGVDLRIHPDDTPERPAEDDRDLAAGRLRLIHELRDRADHAEAAMRAEVKDHDATRARAEKVAADLADMTRQRDKYATQAEKWKSRHAALRADVEEMRRGVGQGLRPDFKGILDRDTARGEQG